MSTQIDQIPTKNIHHKKERKDMQESTHYWTADLSLSAFLLARGHRIQEIKSEGCRGIFCFIDSQELRQDLLRWGNNDKVSISVREFVNGMRDLKGLVGA
jgi:hypothetical protein